ncbi:MAG: zinc ABC transporter substrate-binding protein [Firmicutes bacterium]|nr:zinc ABC transporter substrate-binding protein [Bacillota bacterium]
MGFWVLVVLLGLLAAGVAGGLPSPRWQGAGGGQAPTGASFAAASGGTSGAAAGGPALSAAPSTPAARIQAKGSSEAPVVVVATLFPLADLVRQVAGPAVQVVTLLPPGASPHTFEPSPGLLQQVAKARLLVYVGAGLDDWGAEMARSANPHLVVLEGTRVVPTLPVVAPHVGGGPGPDGARQGPAHAGDDEHPHGGVDPHIWLDPIRMRDDLAPAVARALAQVEPARAAEFQTNLKRLQASLTALDADIRYQLRGLKERRFIAFHGAWQYFAARYGLEQVASIEASPGQEPSAAWMADLVMTARKLRVHVIFAEPGFSPKAAQVLAGEIGGRVVMLDPLELGETGRDTYQSRMREAVATLARALKGGR